MSKKKVEKEYKKLEELISEVEKLKITIEEKEKIINALLDIQTDYNRLSSSIKMKEQVAEMEKQLILNGYIKKDNDVNYLYNRLTNIESSKSWKLYQKLKKVKQKIIK